MSGRSARPAGFGADSRGCFEQLLGWLEGGQATGMTHAELDTDAYPTGIKNPDRDLTTLTTTGTLAPRHDFHGEWNCRKRRDEPAWRRR